MFFLTVEQQNLSNAAHVLYYDNLEEVDEEGKEYSFQEILEYISYIPEQFHQAIYNQTLLDDERLYNEYKAWCELVLENHRMNMSKSYESQLMFMQEWDEDSREIFSRGFHDGEFLCIQQKGDTLRILLDMSGGFTRASLVELSFHHARLDGELEGYYIYDELVKLDDGYGLRILSSFGSPYVQATIYFKEVTTKLLYRPLAHYSETIQTKEEFIKELDKEDTYFIIEDNEIVKIELEQLSITDGTLFYKEIAIGASLDEVGKRIYCKTYVDRFEIFSIPVEVELLIESVLSEDLVLKSRAFNTFYALGTEVASYANELLRKVDPQQTDDILFSLLASHFYELNSLEEDVIKHWELDK